MIQKSAYNFIPAPREEQVFKPEWAEQVSHDIPFEDGESGEIEIKITAQTPVFVRNGHSKYDKEEQEGKDRYLSFSHFVKANGEKEFFIPATSLKGMIRNTLEVFSFSRLNPELVDNNRYAYRDLRNGSQYLQTYDTNKVRAGWLKQDRKKNWTITKCTELLHISHEEVDTLLSGKYKNGFEGFRKAFLNKQPQEKTAKWKYEQVSDLGSLSVNYNGIAGTLVFTGQSSKRNESEGRRPSGKVHEFLFSEAEGSSYHVSPEMQKDFRFIYLEHDSNNISPDWKYWKQKLEKGEKVPVFFNEAGGKIKHFGLAYMYKLPYKHSIHQLSPINTYINERKLDLATTMFGTAKDDALKGRVLFGHAIADKAKEAEKLVKEILGGPKASFYPFYLRGKDYDDEKSELGGFKKYPVHTAVKEGKYTDKQQKNEKVFSQFRPLEKGAEFTAKIRFHNLKKVEIGALLSALTFHNNSTVCSHSLGGARPLGYGKVNIEVKHINYLAHSPEAYLVAFEKQMDAVVTGKWKDQEAVWKYMAMSMTNVSPEREKQYVYPIMDQEGKKNEFTSGDICLPKYKPTDGNFESLGDKYDKEQQEKEEQAYLQIKDSHNFADLQRFLEDYPDTSHRFEIERKIAILEEEAAYQALMPIDEHKNREEEVWLYERKEKLIAFKDKYPNSDKIAEINKAVSEMQQQLSRLKAVEALDLNFTIPTGATMQEIKDVMKPIVENKAFEGFNQEGENKICKAIEELWENEKTKGKKNLFYKKEKLLPINKYPWTDIAKWLKDEEKLKTLYHKLTENY